MTSIFAGREKSDIKTKSRRRSPAAQSVEKAVRPQGKREISTNNKKRAYNEQAQGNHRECLVLSCFFRFCTLAYPRTPTNAKTKNLPTFFDLCPACRDFPDTLSRRRSPAAQIFIIRTLFLFRLKHSMICCVLLELSLQNASSSSAYSVIITFLIIREPLV